jgi:hypothetical protein
MQRLHPIECFETARSRKALHVRGHPYHYVLGPCLALGFFRYAERPCKWFARYRGLNGKYVTKELGFAEEVFPSHKLPALTFEEARAAARAWFDTPAVKALSGRGDNYVATGGLCVCPIGD